MNPKKIAGLSFALGMAIFGFLVGGRIGGDIVGSLFIFILGVGVGIPDEEWDK